MAKMKLSPAGLLRALEMQGQRDEAKRRRRLLKLAEKITRNNRLRSLRRSTR